MLVGEKMSKISAAISYQEHKRSAKFTARGGGSTYCVPKNENTQCKVENDIQSNIGSFFFASLKVLAVESIGFKAFEIQQRNRN